MTVICTTAILLLHTVLSAISGSPSHTLFNLWLPYGKCIYGRSRKWTETGIDTHGHREGGRQEMVIGVD